MNSAYRLDFAQCLAKIREAESDVYIPLSKSAKALGLVQSSHFSYQTLIQPKLIGISGPLETNVDPY